MDIIPDVPVSIQCFILLMLRSKNLRRPANIIPDIQDLVHYVFLLMMLKPKRLCAAIRPACCPHCGRKNPWGHGGYPRKSDHENTSKNTLNPVYIQRYYCPNPDCKRTCSVLPQCIPPRRWYLWGVQQAALMLWLEGKSFNAIAKELMPSRETIHRWITHSQEKCLYQRDTLVNYITELIPSTDFKSFWRTCLQVTTLASAMRICHAAGVYVP